MYIYSEHKARIFTEDGQVMFLKIRDAAQRLLKKAGAFRHAELIHEANVTGDSWAMLACVDRLVELGEIVKLQRDCWTQYAVYTTPQSDNR